MNIEKETAAKKFFDDLWLNLPHCKGPIPKIRNKYVFPEKELRGHSPNFHIHMSVSDLYIPTIDLAVLLQEICGRILGIFKSLTDT
jgi:hypothetical protein